MSRRRAFYARLSYLLLASDALIINEEMGITQLSPPAHPPMTGKELTHALHRHAFSLWRPQAEHDDADSADERPEDVCAPDVEADEHVGRDSYHGELEEPMKRHASSVADAADACREDFGAVQVLYCAEANRLRILLARTKQQRDVERLTQPTA